MRAGSTVSLGEFALQEYIYEIIIGFCQGISAALVI
jgi:hypothetical protein